MPYSDNFQQFSDDFALCGGAIIIEHLFVFPICKLAQKKRPTFYVERPLFVVCFGEKVVRAIGLSAFRLKYYYTYAFYACYAFFK